MSNNREKTDLIDAEKLAVLKRKLINRLKYKSDKASHQIRQKRFKEKNLEKLKVKNKLISRKSREKRKILGFSDRRKRIQILQICRWVDDQPAPLEVGRDLSLEEFIDVYGYSGSTFHKKRRCIRSDEDPVKYLTKKIRSIVTHIVKYKRTYSDECVIENLRCDKESFISHVERNFKPGMSWENREDWIIAAIKPFSGAKTIQEVKELAHYTNFLPVFKRGRTP